VRRSFDRKVVISTPAGTLCASYLHLCASVTKQYKGKGKGKGKETYSSFASRPAITATGTHIQYGITQCYLPPGRGDIPAFTPAETCTQFSDPRGIQG